MISLMIARITVALMRPTTHSSQNKSDDNNQSHGDAIGNDSEDNNQIKNGNSNNVSTPNFVTDKINAKNTLLHSQILRRAIPKVRHWRRIDN